MSVKGIEQIMPKVDQMSRIQKTADEGAAAERFVLQLNQQLQAKRQSVSEAKAGEQQRIDNRSQAEKRDQTPPRRRRPRSSPKKDGISHMPVPGRGDKLDVRT
ncbi:MAG: hypothetical protein GX489_01965 [Firmicutes bacterium]|nr:hypothetical protein [Bacillota bacterium]